MNQFQLVEKINSNKELEFSEKAILNQVHSYIQKDKTFYGTNEYLANHWGTSLSTIKRAIAKLKLLGIFEVKNIKSKHQQGQMSWYNKRYITVNYEVLTDFLNGTIPTVSEEITEVETLKAIEQIETKPILVREKSGPIQFGNYDEEEDFVVDMKNNRLIPKAEYVGYIPTQEETIEIEKMVREIRNLSTAESSVYYGSRSMIEHFLKNNEEWDFEKISGYYSTIIKKDIPINSIAC